MPHVVYVSLLHVGGGIEPFSNHVCVRNLTWMILLKVSGDFAWPGGQWWEGGHDGIGGKSCRVLGDFGDSFYSVIACFYGIGNNLKTGV